MGFKLIWFHMNIGEWGLYGTKELCVVVLDHVLVVHYVYD